MSKRRYILNFPVQVAEKPITYLLVKDYDLKVNILRATINEGQEGTLLVELEGDNLEEALEFLRQESIIITPIKERMSWKKEECINCGACTAVCLTGAFKLERNSWQVDFEPERCVACGMCVNACPLKIISIGF